MAQTSLERLRIVLVALLGIVVACKSRGGNELPADASALSAVKVALSAVKVAPSADAAPEQLPSPPLPTPATPVLGGLGGAYFSDVDSCGACHPDAFAQQQASAHAFASFNNPVYRVAVDRLRSEVGTEASNMCAACHDAALLADGAMNAPVEAYDVRAHNGVSCRLCHGIETAGRDGNGRYLVASEPLPVPVSGDAASLERHKRAVAPAPAAELCGTCHQSFLSAASGNSDLLGGQSELLSWANSPYAGQGASRIDSVQLADCVSCHMPKVGAPQGDAAATAGRIAFHGVSGGHTWLAAMRGDAVQLAEQQALLKTSATLDVLADAPFEGELVLDVVIRNTGVGHRFPGGVRDAANTELRVSVLDAGGNVLLRSAEGKEAHILRAFVADADGRLLFERETHRFAALVADHTIAPRDVAVVRFRGAVQGMQAAHSVRAELVHRSRSSELVARACQESRSRRGRAFANASKQLGREVLRPCTPQPVTVIASTLLSLGDAKATTFDRAYEHGLGLLHELQERVGRATPSLELARTLAGNDRQRAMAALAVGKVASRQGRVEDALREFSHAEALVPGQAAVPAARGDALAKVWRWSLAADAYSSAVVIAPGNASLWRRLAVALGSSGRHSEALAAAQSGLALEPRAADLLRIAALAQKAHGIDSSAAMASYLANRGSDNIGAIVKKCTDRSSRCAREALSVHEHRLVKARKKQRD